MLPVRFLYIGLLIYIVLELVGSSALQYLDLFQGQDQNVIIGLRLLELLLLLGLAKHFSLFESLGLNRPNTAAIYVFIKIALLCTVCAACIYFMQPNLFSYVALPPWLYGVQGLLLMVILAPLLEEVVFRGLLYRMLRERWGVIVSVVVSAVFFSLLHHGLIVSPQLVGGVIFALAYEWSRSLWVAIALHMGANSAVYVLSVFDFAK